MTWRAVLMMVSQVSCSILPWLIYCCQGPYLYHGTQYSGCWHLTVHPELNGLKQSVYLIPRPEICAGQSKEGLFLSPVVAARVGTGTLGPIFEDSSLMWLISLASFCLDAWLRTTPQGCVGSLLAQKLCSKRESFKSQEVVKYQSVKAWT